MKRWIFSLMMVLPLAAREVPKGVDAEPVPLECRIRVTHKGGNDVVTLKVSLENVGETPICVMKPNLGHDMLTSGYTGGWKVDFISPDGETAKVGLEIPRDMDIPPPDPKAFVVINRFSTVLEPGEFIGMSIPLRGPFADLEKVSRVKVTYLVQRKDRNEQPVIVDDWSIGIQPSLWEGKVVSQTFDIARFMNSRPKKK